jgi:hypothetical protein
MNLYTITIRYQPYALQYFETREGWILQSFIRTCPKKFLRYIIADLFDEELNILEV